MLTEYLRPVLCKPKIGQRINIITSKEKTIPVEIIDIKYFSSVHGELECKSVIGDSNIYVQWRER